MSDVFFSWRAITWAEWRRLKELATGANGRPHARDLMIGRLCWNYCRPETSEGQSAEWADQCGQVGCMCPCHRSGSDEYRRQ